MSSRLLIASAVGLSVAALLPRIAAAEEILPAPAGPPLAPAPAPLPPAFAPAPSYGPPMPVPLFSDRHYRSPGLAVALSLQPLPIDFGNLYAENLGWGVAYTAVEVSLLAPMMWMTGSHMNHGANDDRQWSGMETRAMMGLVSGYVVVKLASGLHAGYAARAFNREGGTTAMAVVLPTAGGALLAWSARL